MPKIKRPDWGDEEGDWYIPAPHEMPSSSDEAAVPPGLADAMNLLAKKPNIPHGSAYSPSRNRWRLPNGKEVDAGVFRPLPNDPNTIDSQNFMMERGYLGSRRKRTIMEGA